MWAAGLNPAARWGLQLLEKRGVRSQHPPCQPAVNRPKPAPGGQKRLADPQRKCRAESASQAFAERHRIPHPAACQRLEARAPKQGEAARVLAVRCEVRRSVAINEEERRRDYEQPVRGQPAVEVIEGVRRRGKMLEDVEADDRVECFAGEGVVACDLADGDVVLLENFGRKPLAAF